MTVIDFNSLIDFGQIAFKATLKGLANAHRTNSLLTKGPKVCLLSS